jgi:hypothetical protein
MQAEPATTFVRDPALEQAPFRPLPPVTASGLARDIRGQVSITQQRENVREFLAKRLIAILAGLLLIGFILLATERYTGLSTDDIRAFFELVFTPLIALVSAATGFYFGSSTNRHRSADVDE